VPGGVVRYAEGMKSGLMILLVGAMGLVGCRAKGPPTFEVGAGTYPDAFLAGREVLREYRFALERVDAEEGVLSTDAKGSSGLFTPWDAEQSTVRAELSDTINHQNRRVRITFDPPHATPDTPRTGRVEVVVYRMQNYSLRPNPRVISMSSGTLDPAMSDRGVWPQYEVATTRDDDLAVRLARAIEKKLAAPK